MNGFHHRDNGGIDEERPLGTTTGTFPPWNQPSLLQDERNDHRATSSSQQLGMLPTVVPRASDDVDTTRQSQAVLAGENLTAVPTSDVSVARILGNFLDLKNHKNMQSSTPNSKLGVRQGAYVLQQWAKDLEDSLGFQNVDSENSGEASSLLDQLCQNRENLIVSSPFKLSPSTFGRLESSLSEIVLDDDDDDSDEESECHPFCLSCLKHVDGSSIEFNVGSVNSYTPFGYEELHEQVETEADTEDTPIYFMEIQDKLSVDDAGDDGAAVLEDFAILGDSTIDCTASPLSVKFISSSRLIEILESHADSYKASLASVIEEESVRLPHVIGATCQSDYSSLVAVVTRNGNPDELQYPSFENPQQAPGMMKGSLVLRFRRHSVQLMSHTPDSFSSQVMFSQFFIGRKFCFKDSKEQTDEEETKQLLSSKEFLRLALLNSNRFVPLEKKLQWDSVPDVLISVNPHMHLPVQLARFLLQPEMRRSRYDMAVANAVLYAPQSSHLTYILPRYMHASWWDGLHQAHRLLLYNTTQIESESKYVSQNGVVRTQQRIMSATMGSEADAYYLICLCNAIFSQRDRAKKLYSGPHLRNAICAYIQRTLVALEMERLRSHEDMKKHDLYSVRWQQIEIPPPSSPHPSCKRCGSQNSFFMCAYHSACQHLEANGESVAQGHSVIIHSNELLEMFPRFLSLLRPEDRLVTRIVVPGVADNFPLISVGDLVRFRFAGRDLSSEVIGEVADVVIKSETVLVFLPPPFQGHAPMECFPYLQALLCFESRFVDARFLIERDPRIPVIPRYMSQLIADECKPHFGRFDLRFGFLGGCGFEISRRVLLSGIALRNNKHRTDPKFIHLRRILTPTHLDAEASPPYGYWKKEETLDWVTPLNLAQKTAVSDIVRTSHGIAPYIIYGPAGTGKTMTVCEAILQVLRTKHWANILVCAPSDAACDVLATRLLPILSTDKTKNRTLLRINWWSRKTASLPPSLLPCSPMSESGTFLIPSKDEICAASVVITKCFVAGCLELNDSSHWMKQHFTHLFIDETSQAMECEALVPMLKVGSSCSIVLAGDPKQLSPTVRDPVAAKVGLGISIQERLMKLPIYQGQEGNRVMTKLVGNYRSHDALLTIPSNLFYNGTLECLAPKEVTSPYVDFGGLGSARFPMLLCDVTGKEQSKLDTPSFFNLDECKAIVHIIQGLLRSTKIKEAGGISTGEICVITPFRAQVLVLRAKLRLAGLGSISVGVVEDFQGQENSIVLISTVLTQPHKRWSRDSERDGSETKLGFMHDPKRFNVAITRAHALCIVVGHASYLRSSGTYWTALVEHIQRNDGVIGAVGEPTDSHDPKDNHDALDGKDLCGIRKLVERVEELKLLGAGHEADKLDLSYYYEDTPQWKVMLA